MTTSSSRKPPRSRSTSHAERNRPRPPHRKGPGRAGKAPRPESDARRQLAAVDELEVEIEKLVDGGEGLARFEGIPIFVPRAAPGDRLRVRLKERRSDYARAEIVEILRPGPGRREPPCPHFERCGGCDLQHLDDSLQLRLKAEAVVETLRRIGGIAPPDDLRVIAGESWGYRLRTQLHIGTTIRGTAVGYHARGSHDLVPVETCPVLVPELDRLLPDLPRLVGETSHRRVDLAAGDGERWTASPLLPELPHGEVVTRVGEAEYTWDARCFFQGHRGLLADLVEATVGDVEGHLACDLYAGVGLFSVPLAGRYERVIAVEADRVAARFARHNARRNKRPGLEVEALAIDSWLQLPASRELAPDRVVVDPPRGGISDTLGQWLVDRLPPRLTYVSCHAAALARDLRRLTRFYKIDRLTLLDLFPQTGHMETVVQLSVRNS